MDASEVREVRDLQGALLARTEFINSKLHGKEQLWSIDGTLVIERYYEFGELHGPYHSWWYDGAIKEIGEYRRGAPVGVYRWYAPSGELWCEHIYQGAA